MICQNVCRDLENFGIQSGNWQKDLARIFLEMPESFLNGWQKVSGASKIFSGKNFLRCQEVFEMPGRFRNSKSQFQNFLSLGKHSGKSFCSAKRILKSIRQASCQQPLAFHKRFCEAQRLAKLAEAKRFRKIKKSEFKSKSKSKSKIKKAKSKKQNQNSKIFKARQHLLKNQKDSAKQKIFYFPKPSCQKVPGVPKSFQVARKF
jgi:hypothetical protein